MSLRPDLTPCEACSTPAYFHYSEGDCLGFVPPPTTGLAKVVERLGDLAVWISARLYRYPEG